MTLHLLMPKAFVITSFAEEYRRVYHEAIKPAMDAIGCECHRLDESIAPGVITSEIVEHIVYSDIVIADISEPSPNVFYELGVSHAVGNKTIAIIRKDRISDIPFDIKWLRTTPYTIDEMGLGYLRMSLERVGKALLQGRVERPNNLVQEAGASFFDQRRKLDISLEELDRERERLTQFAQLLRVKQEGALQDNTAVADRLVWKIADTFPKRHHRVLVSICGAGCIGKSTFAALLKERLGSLLDRKYSVSVMPTDSYMLDRRDRLRQHLSGFDPKANNLQRLRDDVSALLRGEAVQVTPYSHKTGRHGESILVQPADVLVLEGIFSFYPTLVPFSRRLKYFIYAEKPQIKEVKFIADCLDRNHDVRTAFNQSEEEYEAYERHILPYLRLADEVIVMTDYWKYRLSEEKPVPPLGG